MAEEDTDRLDRAAEEDDVKLLKRELASTQWPRHVLANAMHIAARNGSESCFRALMDIGVSPASRDSRDRNALHLVLRYCKGNVAILKYALDGNRNLTNAFLNSKDKKGWTPLCYAAEAGYSECVHMLLEAGADVNKPSSYDRETPLIMAANKGDIQTVKLLLDGGADVNKKGLVYNTALSKAVQKKSAGVVSMLIEAGANVNASDTYGHTPLIWAAESGALEAAKILINHGALVNKGDTANRTPLYFAAASQHRDMVEFLLDNAAGVNRCNDSGVSPFLMAIKRGHIEIAELLVVRGASVTQRYCEQGTALHLACISNSPRCLSYLLSAPYAPAYHLDELDDKGKTPLTTACENVSAENVLTLLRHGAKANLPDRHGRTPLTCSLRSLHIFPIQTMEVIRVLLRYGCDVNVPAFFDSRLTCDLRGRHNEDSFFEPAFEMAVRMCAQTLATVLWEAGSTAGRACYWATTGLVPWYTQKELGVSFSFINPPTSESEKDEMLRYISTHCREPRTLSAICRIKIRNNLETDIENKIERLGLPEALRTYLNLPELDGAEEQAAANNHVDSDSDIDFREEDALSDTFTETSDDYSLAPDSDVDDESDMDEMDD